MSSSARAATSSDLVRLQREAASARQEAAESAEAYAQARDENTDLIAQLLDSNAAYDRMAEQLERTAQELQSLLSGAVSVAVADAQRRASFAEQEVAALRTELRNSRAAVRSRSQSPERQKPFGSRVNSPGSQADSPGSRSTSPTTRLSTLSLQNSDTVKHMQHELSNTVKDTSNLQHCIRSQAQDITALKHALLEERSKAKTALSMCNTAHCNHVRSLVARIESTVAPVRRLAASLERAAGPRAGVAPGVLQADARLKQVLQAREWTMEDWDAVEDAAICWLDGLQATITSCADSMEGSVWGSATLQGQAGSLEERLRHAEAGAAAAREGEAAATARESRAQEQAAASSATVRALRAALDGASAARRGQTDEEDAAAVQRLEAQVRAAELRSTAAEAARVTADAQTAEMRVELARLKALCEQATQPAALPAAHTAGADSVPLAASHAAGTAHSATGLDAEMATAHKQGARRREATVQAPCGLVALASAVLPERESDTGCGEGEVNSAADGFEAGHRDDRGVQAADAKLEMREQRSQTARASPGLSNGSEAQPAVPSPVAGGELGHSATDVEQTVADVAKGGLHGSEQTTTHVNAAGDNTGTVAAQKVMLEQLEGEKRELLERLVVADDEMTAAREQRLGAQEAEGLSKAALDVAEQRMEAMEADLAAALDESCMLKMMVADMEEALGVANGAAQVKEAELAAAQRAVESATACVQSMEVGAAQFQQELARLSVAASQASARAAEAEGRVHAALEQLQESEERCAAAELQCSAAEESCAAAELQCSALDERLEEHKRRCAEVQKENLLAELRADDACAALQRVEAVREDALRAQRVATEKVEALQTCTRRAAVAASRRASKVVAVLADAEQIGGAASMASESGVVRESSTGAAVEAVIASQQLWLPALQEQMRGLRAAVDEWLQKLDGVESPQRAVSLQGRAAAEKYACEAGRSSGGSAQATSTCPSDVHMGSSESSIDVAAAMANMATDAAEIAGVAEEQLGRSGTTLNALMSSVTELSMLENALQQPAMAARVQAASQTGGTPSASGADSGLGIICENVADSNGHHESSTQDSSSSSPSADNESIWREITARHSGTGLSEDPPRRPQGPAAAEQGLRRALSRIEAVMGVGADEGSDCSTTAAADALEDLQFHVQRVESFRALAEEVIVRAKERILAHAREQELDVPVTVTERGSVAVEDVATMLDRVLINSSNNADSLVDSREAARAAEADAAALRAQLADHTACSTADVERMSRELDELRQLLGHAEAAEREGAAKVAELLEQLKVAELQCDATEPEAEAAKVAEGEEVQKLQEQAASAKAMLAAADARVAQLEVAMRSGLDAAEAARQAARSEADSLHARLAGAEEALAAQRDSTSTEVLAAEEGLIVQRDHAQAEMAAAVEALTEQRDSARVGLAAAEEALVAQRDRAEAEMAAAVEALTAQRDSARAELAAAEEALSAQRDSTSVEVLAAKEALVAQRGRAEAEMAAAVESLTAQRDSARAELATVQEALVAQQNKARAELTVAEEALTLQRDSDRAVLAAAKEALAAQRESAEARLLAAETALVEQHESAKAELAAEVEALTVQRDSAAAEFAAVEEALTAQRDAAKAELAVAEKLLTEQHDGAKAELAAAVEALTAQRDSTAMELVAVEKALAAQRDAAKTELEAANANQGIVSAELEAANSALVELKRLHREREGKLQSEVEERSEGVTRAEAARDQAAKELEQCKAELRIEQSSKEVLRSALVALQERMAASSEGSRAETVRLQQALAAAQLALQERIAAGSKGDEVMRLQQELALAQADMDSLRVEAATQALEAAAAAEAAAEAESSRAGQQAKIERMRAAATGAEEREEELLQEIQQLEGTVQELSAAMEALQQQQEGTGQDTAVEIQQQLEAVSAQAESLQAKLMSAEGAVRASEEKLEAAAAREVALEESVAKAESGRTAAAAQVEQLQAQVRDLEQDCEALQGTVEDLQEACEAQSAARVDAESEAARGTELALQTVQSRLEQELQSAAKRAAEEHDRLRAQAARAEQQVKSAAAATAAHTDKIAALQVTLLYQEQKYQKLMAVQARFSYAAGQGHPQGKDLGDSSEAGIMESPSSSPRIVAFAASPAQSPESSDQDAQTPGGDEAVQQRLQELAIRATNAEAELEFVRKELENERVIVQQLLADSGTLQAQLDELESKTANEIKGENLAEEVHQLQEAVSIANKDLQVAEAHAAEMQSRLDQKDNERADLQAQLQQQLMSLLRAQGVLEEQFEEMREERDQALADLQLLADQCTELLSEQSRIFMQTPSDSEQVKWLRNKNHGLQRQLAEVLKDVDVLERRLVTLSR